MKKITTILSAAAALLATSAATAQCPGGQSTVTIDVTTDSWGYECYWELTPTGAGCGNSTIAQFGNIAEVGCGGGGAQVASAGGYGDNMTTTEDLGCMVNDACFDINYVDDWGDGGADFDVYVNGLLVESFTGTNDGGVFTFCVSAPAAYDAEITNGMPYEYTQVPYRELNAAGNCINDLEVTSAGTMDLTGVSVTATVLQDLSPVHTETVAIGTLASGAAGTATFAAYMPSAVGNYTVVYQVSTTETDEDPSNNAWGYEFAVGTSTYSRENGDKVGVIGIGAGEDGYLGSMFDVVGSYSYLDAIEVMIDNEDNSMDGATFTLEIFATDGTTPTTSLGTVTGTVGTTATSDWYTVALGTPMSLAPGRYLLALKEDAALQTRIGLASGVFTPNTGWVSWTSQPWATTESFSIEVAFMIRGLFSSSASVAEVDQLNVGLYPNPANDQITLSNIENGNAVEIINAEGKVVYTGAVNNAVETINVSNLDAGFYTVKVTGNNTIGINRFVKK